MTGVTDGNGNTTTYTYDPLDRPTQIAFADTTSVAYTYDGVGNLTAQTDPTGTYTYSYDALNRRTVEQLPGNRSLSYTYDGVGNLTALDDGGGTVAYTYNAVNLVTEITDPDASIIAFAYDANNNRTSTAYPNGVTQTATYDASNRITTIGASNAAGATLTRFDYTYTAPASTTDTLLRHTVTDNDGATTTYSYDALDRLTAAVTKDVGGTIIEEHSYTYDAASNRTAHTNNGTTTSFTFNAANQLTGDSTGTTYSYDGAGNQTGSSAGQALAYNTANQTTSMQAPDGTALTATYAGPNQWQRATAGDTTFTDSLLGPVAETSADGTLRFTRDNTGTLVGRRKNTFRDYYLFDGQGSVVALTRSDGTIGRRYTYDPYGATTSDYVGEDSNPWRYKSRYQDNATGLYKIGMRYYQLELGRWTQTDPLDQRINPAQPPEANPYSYVACNPVNYTDPTGTDIAGCIYNIASAVVSGGTVIVGLAFAGASAATGQWYITVFALGMTGVSTYNLYRSAAYIDQYCT